MTKQEIEDHKVVASKMEWCDIALTIIELENELKELIIYLKKKEINNYNKLIKIYEDEKDRRVKEQSIGSTYYGFFYGHDYVSDWNDYS